MDKIYAKITNDWVLRGWKDIKLGLFNTKNGDFLLPDDIDTYVLLSCDGLTNFNSAAFLPFHIKRLEKFIDKGIVIKCTYNDRLSSAQQYKRAENKILKKIHWAVTGRCNLKCRHCYMESPSNKFGELPFDQVVDIIKQIEKANVLEVSLTGGEPFLRKDIFDIIDKLTQSGIRVPQICTNGILVNDEILKKLESILGTKPTIQISFDGIGAHDLMRGINGVESLTIEAIKRVVDAGFPVEISTCIDKLNISSLKETYKYLKTMNIRKWKVASPDKIGDWKKQSTELSPDEVEKNMNEIHEIWKNDGKPFSFSLSYFFNYDSNLESSDGKALELAEDSYACDVCREILFLLPDGVLLPCPCYTDTKIVSGMPNLTHDSLSEAWERSSLHSIIDIKRYEIKSRNQDCAACDDFKYCGGGCRAIALLLTDNIMSKNPLECMLWKHKLVNKYKLGT
ncbi:radical SAM/SPASM domain-containing protein [Acetivibrio cellulolyticus]|uniref:radical SAM/SPASM domain-containing protein n=1 Tax=Acetivibrio cellulolyticus TaxID=35830 RepID=UPI0001E2D42F|nr:radical SAM protein [Acetivibrio cellulolyticus]